MADIVLGPVIEALLGQLITFSTEQIRLVRDFKKDFDNLKESFDIVKAFLRDAEKKQITDDNEAVKAWLKKLQDLDFEAYNFFDDISYYQLRSSDVGPRNKTVMEKVQTFFPACSCINPTRLELGGKIKDINQKLESMHQHAREFGLQTVISNSQPPVSAILMETDSLTADPVFLGRGNDVSMIVEKLTTAAEQVLSVLPIVGMGGLGKTTLARRVFNHEKIISHFGDKRRVWVHVSMNFDALNILKKILTSITKEKVDLETKEALLQKLKDHLKTERYLLVLDDVWNEDREMWDRFVNSLLGISSATGNCMIVTTRSQKVVSVVRTLEKYELGYLSGDDCWSIIKAKAFINSGDVPVEFESVGKNIAKKCRGSPLAAKVVGGLLRDKSKDEWHNIEMNKLPDFGDDQNTISKILKLSFDNLPSPSLKKCFAYCSIFPKGYGIKKQQLIELWMAEGFLQTDHDNINMETTGSKNFDILLGNSLLQVAGRDDYSNVTHCNMHDLVHDLAMFVVCENGLLQNRRYIGYESSGDELLSIRQGQERFVRTLFFRGKVSDTMLSNFESLHSLTLMGEEDTDELPTSIRRLKHLRYLDISGTRIRYLPDSIGELYHLQTLRVQTEEEWMPIYLEKLPDSLRCLVSLRHLHIPDSTLLPPGIGKLICLQTLPCFHVGGEKGCGISELGNLKDLKGKLQIRNLERVCDKNEAISADLVGKGGIYELRFAWNGPREGEANDESVLEGLQPHPNLKGLEIYGFKGKSLSLWDGLNNLVKIKLEKCSECEELPMLGHLPHLKSLYSIGLAKVKNIRSSFYGNIENCRKGTIVVVFPTLERLELENMSNLKEWDEVDLPLPSQVFPKLKYLMVKECRQLSRAPSHFPCLEELEIQYMESGLALENICGIKLTSLRNLKINKIEGLECLPDWLFSNNHNLTNLHIWNCPNMTHLVPRLGGGGNLTNLHIWNCPKMTHLVPRLGGGGALSLLRELWIWNCPSLRELPDDLHSLNCLERLYIQNCRDLKNLPIEMVESLEILQLIGLNSITNFPMVIGCLHRMTRLRRLDIWEVPKFSSKDIIGPLSLQRLKIGPFSSSDSSWNNNNNVSYNEAVVAIMLPQSIGSLRTLHLHGKEHWDSLPDQLQHLTSLENLELNDFGIEALPEWFGNLSSLKALRLCYCKKLRHLPSKQAMQRLSKLTLLEIVRCPLLLKEENIRNINNPQIVDSEWPNISHIPTVKVNGRQISSDGH